MDDRNKFIEDYISTKANALVISGMPISTNQINSVINRFTNSSASTEEIIEEIDVLMEEFIANFNRMQELRKAYMEKVDANSQLEDLPLEYSGITLNAQDIDLMLIESASTPEELIEAINNANNLTLDLSSLSFTDEQFAYAKDNAYRLYLSSLEDKNAFIRNPAIKLIRKLDYLRNSGLLSEEELTVFDEIIHNPGDNNTLVEKISTTFGEDKAHEIFKKIHECSPIEKSGIKSTTQEATKNLLEQIKENYNSITIDEEVKYGNVALQDGTFDFRRLDKTLKFSRGLDKKVRLNSILFYMDCPEHLYSLEVNDENKTLVKKTLSNYVDATTRFIADNGYSDTVRSIDVFNELANRFAMDGDTPYMYRGDIKQVKVNGEVDDNIKSGWLKHLNIEDLCDVISIARKNLPNVDFMYNDDNVIDSRKMAITEEIIARIQAYERSHGVKLIDSIGTQMHIDNNVTKEQIIDMFRNLSKFGLPIEVTEFDLAMTAGVDGLTDEQIEVMRQRKMAEIYECIDSLREECNIRGVTIWSKTDSQNFRVSLENEARIRI